MVDTADTADTVVIAVMVVTVVMAVAMIGTANNQVIAASPVHSSASLSSNDTFYIPDSDGDAITNEIIFKFLFKLMTTLCNIICNNQLRSLLYQIC